MFEINAKQKLKFQQQILQTKSNLNQKLKQQKMDALG